MPCDIKYDNCSSENRFSDSEEAKRYEEVDNVAQLSDSKIFIKVTILRSSMYK